jgi:hypothetical protein
MQTQEKINKNTLNQRILKGADRSLTFPISLLAAQPKEFFLGWVKEVRTTKS